MVRPIKLVSIALAVSCTMYMVYFLTMSTQTFTDDSLLTSKDMVLDLPLLSADLKPEESGAENNPSPNIFSLRRATTTPVMEAAPSGQLPPNLKVTGIVIAHPSQVVIEDESSGQTYFITEEKSELGMRIKSVNNKNLIIDYQGQDIFVPINQKTTADAPIL